MRTIKHGDFVLLLEHYTDYSGYIEYAIVLYKESQFLISSAELGNSNFGHMFNMMPQLSKSNRTTPVAPPKNKE